MKKLGLLLLFITFFSILSQEILPDKSVTSKAQYGITCTAVCLSAEKHFLSRPIAKIDVNDLANSIEDGNTLYKKLNRLGFTGIFDYETNKLIPAGLHKIKVLTAQENITNLNILNLTNKLERMSHKRGLLPLTVTITSKKHTVLIIYRPHESTWAFFDPLRKNIHNQPGSGIHIFYSKKSFSHFLLTYFQKFHNANTFDATVFRGSNLLNLRNAHSLLDFNRNFFRYVEKK